MAEMTFRFKTKKKLGILWNHTRSLFLWRGDKRCLSRLRCCRRSWLTKYTFVGSIWMSVLPAGWGNRRWFERCFQRRTCSLDLSVSDYFLWGNLKSRVCITKPRDIVNARPPQIQPKMWNLLHAVHNKLWKTFDRCNIFKMRDMELYINWEYICS